MLQLRGFIFENGVRCVFRRAFDRVCEILKIRSLYPEQETYIHNSYPMQHSSLSLQVKASKPPSNRP